MGSPIAAGWNNAGNVRPGFADEIVCGDGGVIHNAARHRCKPKMLVLLPIPVRGQLGQAPESRFTLEQRCLRFFACYELADLVADRASNLEHSFVSPMHIARIELGGAIEASAH